MALRCSLLVSWLSAAMTAWLLPTAQATPPARRLIATGWDNPTPSEFRRHLAEFEKLPFDGAVIRPTRRLTDGTDVLADGVFSRDPWQPAELEAMTAELKEAKPTRAKDNFLTVLANPGDVDWFDDAGWRETVDHWRLLARAAKQGGLRGLLFDAEPYSPPHAPFSYPAQTKRGEHDFPAYAKMARDRGREVMLAVAAEFPDAIILCYRLYSDFLPILAMDTNLTGLVPSHSWGLLPAFIDGWWDAAPPKLVIIEGNEVAGYRANSPGEFNRAYALLRAQSHRLAAPEHRAKGRAQLLVGHGLYLDAYLNPRGSAWHVDARGGPPAARLEANAADALRASDGWVWVYGESGRWWPAPDQPAATPFWADRFPGAAVALNRARHPDGAARQRLAAASPAENRLTNSDFAKEGRESLPEGWWTWQRDDSRGTARREPPVADANQPATASWSAAAEATFGQEITVKSGETYALGARLKNTGHGTASLKVGWKDTKGQWTAVDANRQVAPETAPDADGWHQLAALVRVPAGATQLVFMLGSQGQATADDRTVFARPMAVRM